MAKSHALNIRVRGAFGVASALGAALALGAVPAAAQGGNYSRPVVQPVPPPALGELNAALKDLAHDPANVPALLRAGWASLGLGDTQAALGFFRRAQAVQPLSGEIKAGLATASLRLGDPVTAVRLFAEAEASGTPMTRYAGDRGLALDLVGNNDAAQRFYRQALTQGPNEEITRRLALSQAIAGDQRGAEATLLPLLQHRDLAAYRTRAFALAILGKGEDAVSIAQTMLPAQISSRLAPYLRYMPRLTRAQQAAAANLGQFPPASEIGRDNPQIATMSRAAAPVQVASAAPDARLVPTGQPLGHADRGTARKAVSGKPSARTERKPSAKAADARAGSTDGSPSAAFTPLFRQASAPTPVAAATPVPPAAVAAAPPTARQPLPSPAAVVAAASPPSVPPVTVQPAATSGQALANSTPPETGKAVLVASLPPSSAPSSAPAEAQVSRSAALSSRGGDTRPSFSISQPRDAAPKARVSLADAFADFAAPPEAAPRAAGAVDISRIKPAREAKAEPAKLAEPKVKAKPKPPADPQRFWAQVATGRNVKALGFDWKRLQREAGAVLAKHDPYTARWGQTRRLLTGPYKTEDEADKAVAALKKKGIDAFEFTSDEGEEVTPLK